MSKVTIMSDEMKTEVPAKFKTIVDAVEKLTAIELSELVKVLEGIFGVSAAAPMMMAAAGAGAAAVEEKTEFTVELTEAGASKINVIKIVREVTGLVDAAPKAVKENMPKADAENLKKKLEEAGAKVTLK
jgi:large subunit ribosomal protein L7/L12